MGWIKLIIGAIIAALGNLFSMKKREQQLAEVKDEQIKAAMDRPSADGVDERLRDGKF